MKKPATQSGLVLPESIWSRADKDLVGTTLGTGRIWFTIGQGLLNEVFYPRIDIPQIRDLNFVVADGKNYWSDLRQENSYELEELEPGLPLIVCHHRNPKFNLSLRICPDLCRDVILVDYHYETKNPALELFFILTPRVGNTNLNQHGTTFIRGLLRAIAAEQGPFGLALMGSFHGDDVLSRLQVGLLGQTDAWTDLNQNNTLAWCQVGGGQVRIIESEAAVFSAEVLGFLPSVMAIVDQSRGREQDAQRESRWDLFPLAIVGPSHVGPFWFFPLVAFPHSGWQVKDSPGRAAGTKLNELGMSPQEWHGRPGGFSASETGIA